MYGTEPGLFSSLYRETFEKEITFEEDIFSSPGTISLERQSILCVPVPGTTEWFHQLQIPQVEIPQLPPNPKKRSTNWDTNENEVECTEEWTEERPKRGRVQENRYTVDQITETERNAIQFLQEKQSGSSCLVRVIQFHPLNLIFFSLFVPICM